MTAKRIEDYALVGDGESAALIHRDGSIEWLCFPRFDSPACFAALLGDDENGCWRMRPRGEVTSCTRRYIDGTLILETEFETATGKVTVTDFMPMRGEAPDVVRIVEGRSGTVEMASELALRFDYGRIHPLVQQCGESRTLAIAGSNGASLDFDVPIEIENRWFVSRFEVAEGERKAFVLTSFNAFGEVPERVDPQHALEDTCRFWSEWIGKAEIHGPYRDLVRRSLVTLGALVHQPTGAFLAAPTASLPEAPGGSRNWDYRYCWLRDATFMLLALLRADMRDVAKNWFDWLRKTAGGEPMELQPFYTVYGGRRAHEWEADWLGGFNGAKPVRFGNGAIGQLQLDIYGEVIDTIHAAAKAGMDRSDDSNELMGLIADRLAELWQEPDAGMWESRGEPQHHVYSKAMCWVGFNRAAQWFEESEPDRSERYAKLADKVRDDVMAHGVDRDRGIFTAAYGEKALDAALLRLPMVGFIEADDPVMVATVAAIEDELCRDGLVIRYRPADVDDGVGGEEGAFVAACFWLVDVYTLQGRRDDARALFERVCGRANDLGLLAEELGEDGQRGNFPQGLSHLALVVAAMNLEGEGPAHERGKDTAAEGGS